MTAREFKSEETLFSRSKTASWQQSFSYSHSRLPPFPFFINVLLLAMQLNESSIEAILANLNIKALNEMQQAALGVTTTGADIVLLSATGSGKTLAFLLPLVQRMDRASWLTQALIIVPSRELALQIESVFRAMGTGFKVTCCYGGHLRETEERNLVQPPALIIGTPGRLADHIRRGNITVDGITTLVLDEFDKSLELGFTEEVSFITGSLLNIRQRILTSATEATEVPGFLGLKDPVRLDFLDAVNDVSAGLEVRVVLSEDKDKLNTLFQLICYLGGRPMIIFCNHRDAVERTSNFLADKGINNEFYHGGMEQQQRDSALCKFRNGSTFVLVTTDLASRGLDIPHIRYVIHYHLPDTEAIFTHRNGRTARMEASGTAILIVSSGETVPGYIQPQPQQADLPESSPLPEKPKWATLFIAAGKKDKVNKIDIVGFLTQKGKLKKEDIGLIEVKDFSSFVAIRKNHISSLLHQIKDERIKNKKVRVDVAK
jgi:superfamily II DNA/RNA helicase